MVTHYTDGVTHFLSLGLKQELQLALGALAVYSWHQHSSF